MKRFLLPIFGSIIVCGILISIQYLNNNQELTDVELKRLAHANHLANSSFKEPLTLSKTDRMKAGLPPNRYMERMWELTMDPITGKPAPERLYEVQKKLNSQYNNSVLAPVVPGETEVSKWIERGPNNVGGRTRGLMFDPNDPNGNIVFAGGVSGGLWRNSDITNNDTQWELLNLPENLSVSSITYDPNNTQIFYVGTGESSTSGDVTGNGLWKSSDGGQNWERVLGNDSASNDSYISTNKLFVTSPESANNLELALNTASFGATIEDYITGNIIDIVDDSNTDNDSGGGSFTDGCSSITNTTEVNGKIALIDRGDCPFVDKALNAQNAGAVGVIIINNVSSETPPGMSGDNKAINIPVVSVTQEGGTQLRSLLANGEVTVKLKIPAIGQGYLLVPGKNTINDIVVRDNNGSSEVYAAVGTTYYPDAGGAILNGDEYGLFKSTDEGNSWERISLVANDGKQYVPNDLEIAPDNSIWMATTRDAFGDNGGVVFSSTNGISFSEKHAVSNGDRTEIEFSNSSNLYILADIDDSSSPVKILKSSDMLATNPTELSLPVDADNGIPDNDFTRGQGFYDLTIEVDPNDDNVVYVGGIDMFKSINGGSTWDQISKWSNNNNLASLNVSMIHADQHSQSLWDSNKMIFGNDGGVYFSNDAGQTISSRNNGFNTTQFYSVAVAPSTMFSSGSYSMTGENMATNSNMTITIGNSDDVFIAGAQDNGNIFLSDQNGVSSGIDLTGGDGAIAFFSQNAQKKYLVTNYVFNTRIRLFALNNGEMKIINSESSANGDFINSLALDSNLDILYSNYSSGSDYKIQRYSNIISTVSKTTLSDALLNGNPTAFKVSPYTTDSSTLLVGLENGKLLKLENANTSPTWSSIQGGDFVGSISDIEYGNSENEIYITFYNYGVESIFFSSDGGNSWAAKEGNLPDIPVRAILRNPYDGEEVIVGTDLGVWYTKNFLDANPSWNQAYNGMRNVRVTDLDIRDDYKVFAATYGRGVFSSSFEPSSPTFNLTPSESSVEIEQNQSKTVTVSYATILDFNESANLSVLNLPEDVSASFNPSSPITISDTGSFEVLFTVGSTASGGTYNIEIVAEGASISKTIPISLTVISIDDDQDGILNTEDNCITTYNPGQEDLDEDSIGDACDSNPLITNNYKLNIISETCRDSNNGSIEVTTEMDLSYSVSVTGDSFSATAESFTNTWSISDLESGTYKVCFTISEIENYEQCFNVVIDQPEDLAVLTSVNTNNDTIEIELSGGNSYDIDINGKLYSTSESSIILDLNKGSNTILVSTDKDCQGVVEESFFISESVQLYPNPITNSSELRIGGSDEEIQVSVYNLTGKLVEFKTINIPLSRRTPFPLLSQPNGVYLIRIEGETVKQTIKAVKL